MLLFILYNNDIIITFIIKKINIIYIVKTRGVAVIIGKTWLNFQLK